MVTVSTAAFFERSNLQLGNLRKQAEKLQSQIGTGERLTRSSDDPVAAAKLRSLARRETLSNIDQRNSDRAATDLQLGDQALISIADTVIRAKELAIQAANTTLSDENRLAIGTEIANLRENLLFLANSRDSSGQSLFGGETAGLAYEDVAGVISYIGTATSPLADLGDGQTVERSVTGPEFLNFDPGTGATDMFAVLGALATGLAAGGTAAQTAASDAISVLDSGLEKITTAQTVIGTRQAWVETIDDRRVAMGELLAEEEANIGGADLASTITRLQELMTVLEASQASFIRLTNLSLFDQLR